MKLIKTIKMLAVCAAIFVALCAALSAQTVAKKPSVVIMPFETSGVSQEEYDIMMNLFDSEYASFDGVEVVDRGLISALKAELHFSDSDWTDSRKTSRLGQALNVQQIVKGQLRLYNGIVYFTVQVQDINTLAVLALMSVQTESLVELFGKIPTLCKDLAHKAGGTAN